MNFISIPYNINRFHEYITQVLCSYCVCIIFLLFLYRKIKLKSYIMNQRILLLRSLTTKIEGFANVVDHVPPKQGWISSIRQALGMTALQLANRLGVSQPRIAKMEQNEDNLKISTMKKIASGLGCDFVYGFVPKEPLDKMIQNQAQQKAAKTLSIVNSNMALEDQLAKDPHILEDLTNDMINKNIKQIWDD